MRIFHLIIKEIIHRKTNFLLSFLVVVIAVALFVSFFTTGQASKRETVRLMRDIGFNLRIISKKTDMEKFWIAGFSEYTMPEDYVEYIASYKGISYNHLTAFLQRKIVWNGFNVILTGIGKEVCPMGKSSSPMIFSIKPGTVYIGFELAHNLGLKSGDVVNIYGKQFTIERCLSESGSEDDIRIYAHLNDVQNLLGMKGKINEIKAIHCLCNMKDKNADSLVEVRSQLEKILPDTKVILMHSIAEAREKQRFMAEKYFGFIMPVVLVVCMLWIGVLALINVRERRQEIGIMRALGYSSDKIAFLFLGKAVLIGLTGAVIGFIIGTGLSMKFGPDIFKVTASMIKPVTKLLYQSVIVSPIFCAVSFFIPAMIAVTQDPADILREE
ncbi:hypothetical protein DRQ09_07015 [candidate division KSB1 bacterium]|nr:MAG: hypothetical protein DRQ09_07015 [candidate division KSB1 bacterium]